nr:hypothetical protein [Tanacetum cinerariifolium]
MSNRREMTPPPVFSIPPHITNVNTNERPPVTTTVFAATTLGNTSFAYHASTSNDPTPMISPAFVEANYEILESLLRDRQRHIRNDDLRTELEYFSDDCDEEREMEPGKSLHLFARDHPGLVIPPLGKPLSTLHKEGTYPKLSQKVMYPSTIGPFADPTGSMTPFVCWIKDYPLPDGLKMPSHVGSYDDYARIWWNSQKADSILNYEDLQEKFRSHISQKNRFTKTHLVVHTIKQRKGESIRAFATRIRNLVEHLSTDPPSTYNSLMEKTYTWIKAREVATIGAPNDQRDFEKEILLRQRQGTKKLRQVARSFERPPCMLGSKRSRDMSKYCYFHKDHEHETNDCRQLRSQIEEAVESGQLSHLVKGVEKKRAKTSDSQRGEKKQNITTLPEAPILMISQEEACTRNNISKNPTFKVREITFPLVTKGSNSSAPIIIKAKIFRREAIGEFLLEIMIGDAPLSISKHLNFVIVRSNSLYNMLLGRTVMHKIGMVVSTIHKAVKFHTTQGIKTVFSTHESDKIRECVKKIRETSPANIGGILSCTDAEEKIIVNSKYPKQTVTIGKKLPEHFKERLQNLLRANVDVFAWTHADMKGIPRTIMVNGKPFNTEHKLNEYRHIKPIKHIRRSLCPDRRTIACKEVEELTRARILRRPHIRHGLLPSARDRLEGKVPLRIPPKCFLDAYNGYHQIQMTDEDKTTFFAGEGVYCYRKMLFNLKMQEKHIKDQ